MPTSIPKLAASAVAPLRSQFRNDLLRSDSAQEISYLRDLYTEIHMHWESTTKADEEKELFLATEEQLRELLLGLQKVVRGVRNPEIHQEAHNAQHDFEVAALYAEQDITSALEYQSHALNKVHNALESLTTELSDGHKASKLAYGYDVSGEVFEGSGPMAQEENQKHIDDTAQPQDQHNTPSNPANKMVDVEAENEFPALREFKHTRIQWPARTR